MSFLAFYTAPICLDLSLALQSHSSNAYYEEDTRFIPSPSHERKKAKKKAKSDQQKPQQDQKTGWLHRFPRRHGPSTSLATQSSTSSVAPSVSSSMLSRVTSSVRNVARKL